jgi:RimJ/RimL family protein N-acetyltransferase
MRLKTITAVPSDDNTKSRKLLEKNNFKIDSNLRTMLSQQQNLTQMVIYSLTKS